YAREKDHDFHLLIGDRPDDPNRKYMNMEVSGLPANGPYRDKLKVVRTKFKHQFGLGSDDPADYEVLDTPMKVRITGSLFFDMDHAPPRNYVKHLEFQPKTAWELHPITDIEFDIEP